MSNQGPKPAAARVSPGVCFRCAARGTSCCISPEGIDGPPLTPADELRIAARCGYAPSVFVTEREVDSIEEVAWAEEDPGLRGIVRAGIVRSISRWEDACLFLGDQGCTLGDARPLACKRFPLVPRGRAIEVQPAGHCLAVEEANGLGQLLVSLGMTRKSLRAADEQLQAELSSGSRDPQD
jgi:Fe-S-cluster containining protein